MKIPILHISDMHINSHDDLQLFRYKKIIDAIPGAQDDDDIILIMTGDFAHSGIASEYDLASRAVKSLLDELSKKKYSPRLLIVPGNHDIVLEDKPIDELCPGEPAWFSKEKSEVALYNEYLSQMEDFYIFAAEYGLFQNQEGAEKVSIETRDGKRIGAVLLNSSPFSKLRDSDKESHFIPSDSLDLIRKDEEIDIMLVLCHHGPEWFSSQTKNYLESLLFDNCDMLFIGHEHLCHAECLKREDGKTLFISRAGMISDNDYEEGAFALHYLDTDTFLIKSTIYKWNGTSSMYIEENVSEETLTRKCPFALSPRSEFVESLFENKNAFDIPISDIFVFPDLNIENYGEDSLEIVIDSEEKLYDYISSNKIVCLNGNSNSGRTTLLKRAYQLCMQKGMSPLFLSRENHMKSLNKLFDAMICDQYGASDICRAKFSRIDKSKKVMFIDDFDLLRESNKSQSDFIYKALEYVGHIVFVSGMSQSADINETIKRTIGSDNAIRSIRIKELYKEKRDALVRNVCRYRGCDSGTEDAMVIGISKAVSNHRQLCDLNPDFMIQNVIYRIENTACALDDDTPFTTIYEYNLKRKLQAAHRSNNKQDTNVLIRTTLRILQAFAYKMHKKKQDSLSVQAFRETARDYIERMGIHGVDEKSVLELSELAGIMRKSEELGNIEFCSMSYLAYFIAKELDTKVKHGNDISDDMEYLLRHIVFDINNTVLLFLSILREDIELPVLLCDELEVLLSDFEEFSFDEKNIGFMCRKPFSNIKMVEIEDKNAATRALSQYEEEADADERPYLGIYEYNEDEMDALSYKLLRALKYIMMVGKFLRAQYVDLPRASKEKMISAIYKVPNQFLYALLVPLDNDETIDELHALLCEDFDIEREAVVKAVEQIGFCICLSIYEQVAYAASRLSTYGSLSEKVPVSTNGEIQKLLIDAYGCDTDTFISHIKQAFLGAKKRKDAVAITYIRAIMNWYISNHTLSESKMKTIRNSGLFTEQEHKQLLMERREKVPE